MTQSNTAVLINTDWPVGLDPDTHAAALERAKADLTYLDSLVNFYWVRLEEQPLESLEADEREHYRGEVLERLEAGVTTRRKLSPILAALTRLDISVQTVTAEDPLALVRFACPLCEEDMVVWDSHEGRPGPVGQGRLQHTDYRHSRACRINTQEVQSDFLAALGLQALDPEVLDWDDSDDMEREPDWMVDGIVARGDYMSLFGPAEVGKSLLMLDWALQMVRRGLRVLYLDKENAPDVIRRRLKKMGATQEERTRLMVLPFVALPDLATQEGADALREKVDRYRADVVVFDTISKFSQYGQASQSDRWQLMYNLSFVPLLASGKTIIQLDHVGYANRDRERDSSAKRDNVAVSWALASANVKDRDRLVLTRVKNRPRHPGADSLAVVREDVPLLRHVIGQAVSDDLKAALSELERAGVPAGAGRPTAREYLNRAEVKMSDALLNRALKARKDATA
ncbi:AAA family ATPase [Micromonospora sp. NPDC000442]|uniref:AAA family ATPase n=1 Tax=Micromonospora sp. NPDC000442 TaxID=3364217 RepID=UPI0036C089FA